MYATRRSFPTTIKEGKNFARDPVRVDRAAQRDRVPRSELGRSRRRPARARLLNMGLPGNLVTDGTMMVSLLRAHTLGAYGFGGGYEPGMSSDSGFQLGQERIMRYCAGSPLRRLARSGRLP